MNRSLARRLDRLEQTKVSVAQIFVWDDRDDASARAIKAARNLANGAEVVIVSWLLPAD
jgi:hypothetical protein